MSAAKQLLSRSGSEGSKNCRRVDEIVTAFTGILLCRIHCTIGVFGKFISSNYYTQGCLKAPAGLQRESEQQIQLVILRIVSFKVNFIAGRFYDKNWSNQWTGWGCCDHEDFASPSHKGIGRYPAKKRCNYQYRYRGPARSAVLAAVHA